MPRSFAAWNEKRRPIARCATSPHAQPPEGFSHTQPTSPRIQGLNIDELVSQLTENELMLAPSAASLQPALLLGSEAEWSPPPDTALIHPVAAGQPGESGRDSAAMETDALPLAACQLGPGTCAIAMHPAAHVPAHLHAPVGGPSRVGATFAAAGPSSDEGTTEPPLVWSACRCPISADCNGVATLPREMRRDGTRWALTLTLTQLQACLSCQARRGSRRCLGTQLQSGCTRRCSTGPSDRAGCGTRSGAAARSPPRHDSPTSTKTAPFIPQQVPAAHHRPRHRASASRRPPHPLGLRRAARRDHLVRDPPAGREIAEI